MSRQLVSIAEGILFQKQVEAIFEELLLTPAHLLEADGEELSDPEKKAMDSLMNIFVTQLKKGASEVKATVKDPEELADIKKDIPELEKLDSKIKESEEQLEEMVISTALVAGIIAAIPKLIELFGYLVNGVSSVLNKFGFKKGADATKKFADKVIHAGHDLHHKYIGGIVEGMKILMPGFKTIDQAGQEKIAELVYVIILITLGMDAGVNTMNALQHAEWLHVGIEGALASIKAGEVGGWLATQIAAMA